MVAASKSASKMKSLIAELRDILRRKKRTVRHLETALARYDERSGEVRPR